MELYLTPRLNSQFYKSVCCEHYLERLPFRPELRHELLTRSSSGSESGSPEAMVKLHHALSGYGAGPYNAAFDSVRSRLGAAYGASQWDAESAIAQDDKGHVRLVVAPPLDRVSMAPLHWPLKSALHPVASSVTQPHDDEARGKSETLDSPTPRRGWNGVAALRRTMLLALVLGQTWIGAHFMADILPYNGAEPLEITILVLFTILFAWVSAGFWTAMTGFLLLLKGRDRHAISASVVGDEPIDSQARTAIVMPICNEDVKRVFAGLRATYESLGRTGELDRFDFFVLSDSGDPDIRVAETQAWLELRQAGLGRVFYRWRQHRIKRKSGNVADFCRRWGNKYRYMVVLDADSLMSGECLTKLVRLMEANPNAGIIQTAPSAVGRETLYARIQQFASRVYGPLFVAGLHFWQLGESHYWGHNAIIRVAPFIRHCALGRLEGRGPLSGEILSHDFVEAALMRRAGWGVWIAYDLPGSYEETPPNLVDELKRERRWCQGNLINFRLSVAQGIHPAHRAVFVTGVMAYLSAPLWFLFLMLATGMLAQHTLTDPVYFVQPEQLFPLWPEWHPARAIGLFGATAVLLLLPKILAVVLVLKQGAKQFGGELRLIVSTLAEMLFSAMLAPVRMMFHTQFVVTALVGWAIQWKSPPREDAETTWEEAVQRHGLHTVFGAVWASLIYSLNPAILWWLLPIVGSLMLSIPLSVLSSRVSLGRLLRKARLFLIPEECRPPNELRLARKYVMAGKTPAGFIESVIDPVANAVICASGMGRVRSTEGFIEQRSQLVLEALTGGPEMLSSRQKMLLLNDPVALSELHLQAWTSINAHPLWIDARATPTHGARVLDAQPAGVGAVSFNY
ncbi:MAG TPA: glucans biosynthesis glucosyltransferase MdoH [Burkholderiales bacterium]|nr:glucans biosynthesis glucosyltransferase MdoH [Burkholderiales bacterium]